MKLKNAIKGETYNIEIIKFYQTNVFNRTLTISIKQKN